jgi:serine protease Do
MDPALMTRTRPLLLLLLLLLLPVPWSAGAATPESARRTALVEAVERVAPSVVSITTETPTQDPFYWFYGQDSSSSEGSGVVIDPSGIVLTNAHVVERASKIQASFADGTSHQAEIVGIAPELDLAVLRLKTGGGLSTAKIGSSEGLLLGEPVIAIGNPYGLGHTVTTGVVSAVKRPLETESRVYQDFIQTDASINPGNSGGPLLNVLGELVGINTAIHAEGQGIGFAIPVDRAMKVANDLLHFGAVQMPWLGADLGDVLIRRNRGRMVAPQLTRIHPGSPAAEAGLRPGDLIVGIDGREVQGRSDLNAYLSAFSPPRSVELLIWRDGHEQSVSLLASELPGAVIDRSIEGILGIGISDRGGVVVSSVDPRGAFARNRLLAGDWILALNGMPVDSVDQLRLALAQAKSQHSSTALFTVRRGNAQGRIELPI